MEQKCRRTHLLAYVLMIFIMLLSQAHARTDVARNTYEGSNGAKYVFLFIGDGMGLPQVAAAEIYAGALKGGQYPDAPRALSFTGFPAQGITTTHDVSSFITDSASSGTAIATGQKTLNGVIAMAVDKQTKLKSIAKMAKEKGMKVGIVSSVSIDHATPATFYAQVPSRGMMYDIGVQMIDSGFDYFGGGSVVDPDGLKSKMAAKPGNLFEYAQQKGYTVTRDKAAFNALTPGQGKVWAVTEAPADSMSMLYEIDRPADQLALADFTGKAIDLLDNPEGFFIMVEGGKIDWASHANDAMSTIKDVFAFDEAVKKAVDFAKKHPQDTLIIVTGDHECGGMTIGFAGTKYDTFFEKLQHQRVSYVKFDALLNDFKAAHPNSQFNDLMPLITQSFGLTLKGDGSDMDLTTYELDLLKKAFTETMKDKTTRTKDDGSYIAYGGYEPLTVKLTHILNRKAGIAWTSYSHTGVPVPTYAMGIGAELFDGYYDNTDMFAKTASIMKLK